jgi:NAD(P)-dependent dehydrogenase (short-subunit alcohol dehydrogenase family)
MKKDLFSLNGKVVVITGAAGLLGCQHADAVASFGGSPVLLDLDKVLLEDQAIELNAKYGVDAVSYVVDITSEKEVEQNCKDVVGRYGKIDALVNNAANNPKIENSDTKNFSRLENFPLELWHSDLEVGLTGAFLCAKHYGEALSKNPNGGVIINISSDLGLIAPDQRLYKNPNSSVNEQPVKPVTYSVIKTGLIGLTRYIATYWPERVRCNALCPGGVDIGLPEDFLEKVKKRIPMNRMASPDEYQGVLIFLLSDSSKYMNGAIIPMDGGRTVW